MAAELVFHLRASAGKAAHLNIGVLQAFRQCIISSGRKLDEASPISF